jgi:hypothetical protein
METLHSALTLLLFGGLTTFMFVGPLTVLLIIFLARVPKQHRQMPLGRLWLLTVPLLHMVWMYFALTRVSRSFQRHFAAQGKTGQGDCGHRLAVALVAAVWVLAVAPTLWCVLGWNGGETAIVLTGLTVFGLFAAYVVRMLDAARAMV